MSDASEKEQSSSGNDPAAPEAGKTKVKPETPENKGGRINPSAPEDSNVTPGSAGTK